LSGQYLGKSRRRHCITTALSHARRQPLLHQLERPTRQSNKSGGAASDIIMALHHAVGVHTHAGRV
jgi:hypothetical protein